MQHDVILSAPPLIRDFLFYNETIRGKSSASIAEYFLDLQTFFRYMKKARGLVSSDCAFRDIGIDDIDAGFLSGITLGDAYAFLAFCKDERHNGAATRARKASTLRSFFKYLTTKAHVLKENPLQELESPKIKKALPKYLSLEQSMDLLNTTGGKFNERDYCILTLFLNCGLRLSELCGINLGDIQNQSLKVTGKGNKERIVHLNAACVSAIEQYLRVRPRDGVKAPDRNALFLSRLNRRISNKTVQHIIYMRLEEAGLGGQGFSVHKLRHTAATLMYQYGHVDIRVLKDILGHENLGTTEIYTHLSSRQIDEAIDANPLAKIKKKGKPS